MTSPTGADREFFHGVAAPAWADDHVLVEILHEEALSERDWFGTDRDKALLLTVADRIELLLSERAQLLAKVREMQHWIGSAM